MIVQEYIQKFDELSRYAPKIVAIEKADEEKKEEKQRKKWSMDQGNFLANTKDNAQIIIRERERQWSKIRIKANAQRIIKRRSYKSQGTINAVELILGDVEPIPEHVLNVEGKDTSSRTARE